jgi:hypothetical protein
MSMKASIFAVTISVVMLAGAIAVACGGSQPSASTPGGDGGTTASDPPREHEAPSHEH